MVACGVSKDASPDQLKNFVESNGISVINIEKLTTHPDARTNAFKIVIKVADYDKAMNPAVWPYRVGVRHYKAPRRNPGMSLQDQTRHAGGGGQPQTQQHAHRHQREESQAQSKPSPFNLNLQNRYEPLADVNGEVFMSN